MRDERLQAAEKVAPGAPGIEPRWTSSAKSGVGTSWDKTSRVWFTISHGILDEIYYPRIDHACTRDMGLIVTDGRGFFSEEKRDATSVVAYLAEGVPGFRLVNTCREGRYRIEKEIVTDPRRHVLLQRTRFVPLRGTLQDYHLYVLLAPHLDNQGMGNTGWLGEYKGVELLLAERNGTALALGCSAPWRKRSVGFVGVSDGWQDLHNHGEMQWSYQRAENGNVALTGEIDLAACGGEFVLALGFGRAASEAGHRVRASLQGSFAGAAALYRDQWQAWQKTLLPLDEMKAGAHNAYRVSTSILGVHESADFPGGMIASLSIPWGFAKGDNDLGGYHLVWPRDLVEGAGALLACGAREEVRAVLEYLRVTQETDGHWPQNMWMDGTPYWDGVQLDETAFPILLVNLAQREGVIEARRLGDFWPMVRQAAAYLVCQGPATQQDRWEEDPGFSPFTLAAVIAALLVAAQIADAAGEKDVGTYLRETADAWNAAIERWTYVTGTELARQVGVEGYYVRIAPPTTSDAASPAEGFVAIKNRASAQDDEVPAAELVSPDALALVRFGLRAPDDPRIRNTIRVIDHMLRKETPAGPAWYRYNGDGYGEHADGAPFDGAGIGRLWPLLTGERAHYEVAAGNMHEARRLLGAFEGFASDGGLIPEQIWDRPAIAARELSPGRPSGSAMPLVWGHAEHVKLLRSLRDGVVFDRPAATVERYAEKKTGSKRVPWRFGNRVRMVRPGQVLRIETQAPAVVHWGVGKWENIKDEATRDSGVGMHWADLPTEQLEKGAAVHFTFYWPGAGRWEGREFMVQVGE